MVILGNGFQCIYIEFIYVLFFTDLHLWQNYSLKNEGQKEPEIQLQWNDFELQLCWSVIDIHLFTSGAVTSWVNKNKKRTLRKIVHFDFWLILELRTSLTREIKGYSVGRPPLPRMPVTTSFHFQGIPISLATGILQG